MISVRVDFSLGGMECKWWACLWAGALKGVWPDVLLPWCPLLDLFERGEEGICLW